MGFFEKGDISFIMSRLFAVSAGWVLWAGSGLAQEVTVGTPSVTEGDAIVINAEFRYEFPSGPAPRVFEFAVLGQNLQAGADFVPIREMRTAEAGVAFTGTVAVPVRPDLTAEGNGLLSVVVREPAAADWAAAISAPVEVSRSVFGAGTNRFIYWGEEYVVSAAYTQSQTASVLRIHERTAAGEFILRLETSFPSLEAFSAQANSRIVTVPVQTGLKTWRRSGNSSTWLAVEAPLPGVGEINLFSDRLVATAGENGQKAIYRLDPGTATGWRRTGEVGPGEIVATADDFLVLRGPSGVSIWERAEGTEDHWHAVYRQLPTPSYAVMGTAPGTLALFGPGGLEIHERLTEGWKKAGTLGVTPDPTSQMSLALAGDWIAVGQSRPPAVPQIEKGNVRLFLRSTGDRSIWEPVGQLPGPGADYGRQLSWNGPELTSAPSPFAGVENVVVRRFNGATAVVRDDDRDKPQWLAVPLKEPATGSQPQSVLVELPLAAASEVVLDYEVLDGTAKNGSDFTAESGRIAIAAGSARGAVQVTVASDGELEPAEYFTVRLLPPGQPAVTARVEIRESGPPAVVTASATPLVEGYQSSTVTLRQSAATASYLPAAPGELQILAGGFDAPPADASLTTLETDLATLELTRQLTVDAPESSFTVTAIQDSVQEWKTDFIFPQTDERVRTAFTGLGTAREAGTLGWAFDGPVPPIPAARGDFPDLQTWAMGGEWFFASWGKRNDQTQITSGLVAVHRLPAGAHRVPAAVQYLPWESRDVSALFCDDETLVMSLFLDDEQAGPMSVLRVYDRSGPVEAPWRLASERRQLRQFETAVQMLRPDRILWGRQLLEKTGGLWKWRLAATTTHQEIVDADGDWLLMRGDAPPGSLIAYRRAHASQPLWTRVREFNKSHDQQAGSIDEGWVRGRTLVLTDGLGRTEIHRETAAGGWQFEQSIPNAENSPRMLMAGESTLVLAQGIYSRTGPASLPWTMTGGPPEAWNFKENLGLQDHSLSAVDAPFGGTPRLRIMRAGIPLTVYDDDSLQFSITTPNNLLPFGSESYFGETVAQLALRATRTAPFPMTVRVRSQDTGSAMAGLDYAPLDVEVAVPPPGQTAPYTTVFPFRIFSDRIPEIYESLNLIVDAPLIGSMAAPAVMSIHDTYTNTIKAAAAVTALTEPMEGIFPQSVEFLVEVAFEQDVDFVASIVGGGTASTATDFVLPSGKVVLKAGENRLRVPVSVASDALDEPVEHFTLRIVADPVRPGFTASASVSIFDAVFPGLAGDVYVGGLQGAVLRADGQAGRPAGVKANDPSPPSGAYKVSSPPEWGSVEMSPDGAFTATPGPNVTGTVAFAVQVETIPFQRYGDSTTVWKYLHPLTGISPAVADPDFPATWATENFDDTTWDSASGTLTYGGFPIAVTDNVVPLATPPAGSRYTDYFRTIFQSEAAVTVPLTLQLYCDDGAIIYVNGTERGRAVTVTSPTFSTAADTYTMLTGGSQSELQEVALQTVALGEVPLKAGANILAISLHNNSNTSSDLGLRLISLETGVVSDPMPVTIQFSDALVPPVGTPDAFDCPQNAAFLSSDHFGAGLLGNDGLFSPSGQPYDPILEITASPVSAGTLTLIGNTGHFIYTPPADFSGTAEFTYQIRDKDGLSLPVPVSLNVKPILPFDLWKEEALSAEVSGAADSDGDGLINFLEYALGTDPGDPAAGSGHGFVAEVGGQLSLMIRRAADLAWTLESAPSPEAGAWRVVTEGRGLNYQSPPPAGIVISNATTDSQVLIITADPAASPTRFYRLRTLRIPPQ